MSWLAILILVPFFIALLLGRPVAWQLAGAAAVLALGFNGDWRAATGLWLVLLWLAFIRLRPRS